GRAADSGPSPLLRRNLGEAACERIVSQAAIHVGPTVAPSLHDGVEAEVGGDRTAACGSFGGPALPLCLSTLAERFDPLGLPGEERRVIAGKLRRLAAIDQQTNRQVNRIAHHMTDLDIDLAGREIALLDGTFALAGELRAVRASVADEFDQLGPSVGIADAMTKLGLGDHGIPIRWRGARTRGAAQHRCCSEQHGCLDDLAHFHASPSLVPRLRASDSKTVRSSGSPISRKESPNSIGIGLSDGGAVREPSAWGGLTVPCRSLTRATAL